MTSYQDCSQDELLGIIEKLEAENRRLRQRGKSAGDAADNDAGELAPGRFKAKYAAKILDRLPDMLTVLSPEGVLVDLVSSEQTNHIGEPGNALIGRDICTMLSAEAYASVKDNLDRVNASGEGSTSHHDITLDGVTRHYENRIFKLDEQYALCMCRDVTEQQQAKNELEQAYRRMKMAEQIEALNHWYYYEQSDEVESPGLVGRLPGIGDPQAVRCRSEVMFSAIHPADRAKVLRLLTRGEFPGDYVEFRIRLDGEDRFLHSRVIYTGGEPGSRVIEGYTQDMTRIVEPVRIDVAPEKATVEQIRQSVFFVGKTDKKDLLLDMLRKDRDSEAVLVFSRTKHGADRIARILFRAGIGSEAIHGNKSQSARQRALSNFKEGRTRVMVATDIAARGIDIEELPLVINYDLPEVAETYVHRIGRTGRAGRCGRAFSFCCDEERPLLKSIERLIGRPIPVGA